jgi:hypothetical protein
MARAQSRYLRIFDDAGTYQRWQSYYINSTVEVDSQFWQYQQFDFDVLTDGQTGDEGGVPITLPATTTVIDAVNEAIRNTRLVEILIYEFDSLQGDDEPQDFQELIATYVGEVVGGGRTMEEVSIELGSSLSPVGSQVPPRKFTSRLIGVPCKL